MDTSSPASSSSLLNRLQLDDDLDGETRDLFVTVDDPKKHVSAMETYITYRVSTKVSGSTVTSIIVSKLVSLCLDRSFHLLVVIFGLIL